MSDENEVVGHKTFATGDPLHPFRQEPLTRKEADALLKRVDELKAQRAADMPTEQDAVNALWNAQQRLKELGWCDPREWNASKLRAEGVEAMLVEFSSSGIHRGYYHAVNGKDTWWIGPDGSPSSPCLVRPIEVPAASTTRSDK